MPFTLALPNSASCFVILCLLISCNKESKSDIAVTTAPVTTTTAEPSAGADTVRLNLDGVIVSPVNFRILMENEVVRVVEYSLAPGTKDNVHTHPPKSGYVVSGGTLKIYPENGTPFISEEKTGDTFWSPYVGKHYDENIGSTTVKIVLTEIKALE